MEEIVDFTEANFNNVLRKFTPMVSQCSYAMYERYKAVMDIDEAYQEVRVCLWNCLKHYNPKKFKFSTYFLCSFHNLQKRYYWSHLSEIKIAQNKDENFFNEEGVSKRDEDAFVQRDMKLSVRSRLSQDSKEIYDVYMKNFRVNPWIVSQKLNISRHDARKRFRVFALEVRDLLDSKEKVEGEVAI
jgi:DNA-directed RNA polymerase specialized sigma24 family protein